MRWAKVSSSPGCSAWLLNPQFTTMQRHESLFQKLRNETVPGMRFWRAAGFLFGIAGINAMISRAAAT
jgi:hypothetical protein